MRKVIRFDENGHFVEDVMLEQWEQTSEDCTEIMCGEGFYVPKFDGEGWVEGLTVDEINAIKESQIKQSKLTLEQLDDAVTYILTYM